ncbi:3-oxoacyl-ACP synthase [Amycolatopsis sp. WAC 04182]|nr:3-oxoacyl-ACP synthase [Amycolatopsis sp. WAC 04182]
MDTGPIGILGTGSYVPTGIRTNEQVAAKAGVDAEWIAERTGIRCRHVAGPEQASSDLAAEAVRNALEGAGLAPEALGLLVLATSTPDELGPSSACRVQALLGAHNAVAFDVSAACTGWLFGARVAHDWLRAGTGERYAAVVGVECYSRFLDEGDRATASLFGDGAAAAVLGQVEEGCGFAPIVLGSDGRQAGDVLIPAGGSRAPSSTDTVARGGHLIHMDGGRVREFILDIFPKGAADALGRSVLSRDEVDLVISHQPNPVLVRWACEAAGLDVNRLVVVGDKVGNIGAGGLPYALASAHRRGRLRHGDRILVVGFGAGLTWGSTVLTWDGAARNGDRMEEKADALGR